MRPKSRKVFRCAIYTRKSTDHGLELEFNSLHAQREACEAYIKSQASEGWAVIARHYDDPAYSGGNMDRPALRNLLKDIDAGLVDVVVVYKIDRLTRALADFAKLVEAFDAKSVSFVAVTQQFNTTTSMGRLTLNVLLSFAQFERELSSERVRDKVAASRKKGKWTGGSVPLGYDSIDKRLAINESEADTVRMIFRRYLALKSFQALVAELDQKGVVTKTRPLAGKTSGGIPFTYGPLAYLLKNRTYIGETGHKGLWFAGEHAPILDRPTFNRVRELLKSNSITRKKQRHDNRALLSGILFDDRENRMSPSFTSKKGVRYPFYVSAAILKGRKANAGSMARIPADGIENAVVTAIRDRLTRPDKNKLSARDVVEQYVVRVTLSRDAIKINLRGDQFLLPAEIAVPAPVGKSNSTNSESPSDVRMPMPRAQLVQAITRAHGWVKLLSAGEYETVEALAQDVKVHPKVVRNAIRLAFLAPDITTAILDGSQPEHLTLGDLKHIIPLSWPEQRKLVGMAQ